MSGDLSSILIKDQYRKYFEDSNVITRLMEILEKLLAHPEKPSNPMNFILQELGGKVVPDEVIDQMENDLADAQRELRRLRSIAKGLGIANIDKVLHGDPDSNTDLSPQQYQSLEAFLTIKKEPI